MKKLVFALGAVAMLSMVSCGKKETPAAEKEAIEEAVKDSLVQEVAEEKAAEAVAIANVFADVPKFSNQEVQKFAEEYAAYYKEVVEATKAKDVAKATELAKKAQEWTKSAEEKLAKMTPEDAKAWGEWAQKIAAEVATAQAQ